MMDQLQLFVDRVLHNRYQITSQLGRGGMGAVYEAQDLQQNRPVAIKQMLPLDPNLRLAFKREATILSQINHPGLPHAIDYFENETGLFIAMEFIPGQNLGQLLASRGGIPFPHHQVRRWAEELLQLLIFLHTQNPRIIHRDVKPTNLKLTPQGQIVLLDFGLAKELNDQDDQITNICILAYTPHYAPLEQIQGESTNTYSDIYALGATLYHLLTGVAPIDSLKRATNILCKKKDPLPHIAHVVQGIPQSLASLVMKALSLAPSDRPESASQMLQQLQAGIVAPSFRKAQNTFSTAQPEAARLEATNGYPVSPEATLIAPKNNPTHKHLNLVPYIAAAPTAQRSKQFSVQFPASPLHLATTWPTNIPTTTNSELQHLHETNKYLHTTNAGLLNYARTASALLVILCVAVIFASLYRNDLTQQRSQDPHSYSSEIPLPDSETPASQKSPRLKRRPSQSPAIYIEDDIQQDDTLTIEEFIREQILKERAQRAKKKTRRSKPQLLQYRTQPTIL